MPDTLPAYGTPILGRRRAMAEVEALLLATPIVTVVGAGGIGKTRVAVEVARGQGSADGVWFVDLAPIAIPGLVPATVATAIGLELNPAQDPTATLVAALANQRMLLVLDNCEHVVAHAARLAETLARSCPYVRVLATSREPLGVRLESVYRLETLDEPAAIELFAAQANHNGHAFALTAENEPIVADICRRLDGIALAIQLAASHAGTIPLADLRARLDERFRILTGRNRATLPRQQTMHASIDWSYDLLGERERPVFRRLAVFSGSFTLEAACRVASDDTIESWEVVAAVTGLAEKSMIASAPGLQDRYQLLECMREYALQRLQEGAEVERTRRAHAAYYADRSAEVAAAFGHGTEEGWLAEATPDLDNFRTALDWAMDADARVAAARMGANLGEFWTFANLVSEGADASHAVLAMLAERAEEPRGLPVLLALGELALSAKSYRQGAAFGERALDIAASLRDGVALAEARRIAGLSRYRLGIEREAALEMLRASFEYLRVRDNPLRTMRALRIYGWILGESDPARGRELLSQALASATTYGWPRIAVIAEIDLAELEFASGEIAAAAERTRRVIATLRARKSPLQLGNALENLASYLSVAGDRDGARAAGSEATAILRAHGIAACVAHSLQSLALAYAQDGDLPRAAQLLGYVDACCERFGGEREPTESAVQERLLALLRGGLDAEAYIHYVAAGRQLSETAACELAEVKG